MTLLGAPRWANGGRSFNWAPRSGASFASFAYATQKRYPFVRDWLIWNEPNQRRWLRPTSASVYVSRLLNPAYTAIEQARRSARVAGGVTAPRGSTGGVSPVRWIRGMDAARARLDAYAHHPYPLKPWLETPTSGGCTHCETITMATLERLISEVRRAFGNKRIWLTEYGYQTRPHDRTILGVSQTKQAQYLAEASLRAYRAPFVDVLIKYMVIDDGRADGWQSGLYTKTGAAKLSAKSFPMPLAQVSRRGTRTIVWGQLRAGSGKQSYRLRMQRGGKWTWVGGNRRTSSRGFFSVALRASRGGHGRAGLEPAQPAATAPRSSSANGTLRSGRSRPRSGSGSRRGAWRPTRGARPGAERAQRTDRAARSAGAGGRPRLRAPEGRAGLRGRRSRAGPYPARACSETALASRAPWPRV